MANKLDMTQGKPVELMLRFAVPVMLANVCQLMYSIVDSAVVGRLIGVKAFAAVGAAGFYYWMLLSVLMGLTQGFGTMMAQRFGAKDVSGLKRVIGVASVLTMGFGSVFAICGAVLARPVLVMLGTPADILDGAALYLHIMVGGMGITALYNLLGTVLRSLGDSRTPLMGMVYASVINVVLDVGLVVVTGWGIGAVAAATLIAQGVACWYEVRAIVKVREVLAEKGDYRWDVGVVKGLMRLGAPAGVRNFIIAVGGLVVQYAVNGYGTLFIAGVALPNKLYGLMEIVGAGMDGAVAVYVAQNYGAGLMERIRKGIREAGWVMVLAAVGIAVAVGVSGRWMMGMMVEGDGWEMEKVMEVAMKQLGVMLLGLPFLYLLLLWRSALSGMGEAVVPMVSGFVEMGVRLGCVLGLGRVMGEWGVYLAVSLGWPIAMALLCIAYHRRLPRA